MGLLRLLVDVAAEYVANGRGLVPVLSCAFTLTDWALAGAFPAARLLVVFVGIWRVFALVGRFPRSLMLPLRLLEILQRGQSLSE